MVSLVEKVDNAFQKSFLGKFFEMEERGAKLSIEFCGALATFMSMAYILAVNPLIISDSGGPCIPDEDGIFGPAYSACIEEVKRQLITSTALASMFGCFVMGIFANLPIALAPGMGMNAYFTYTVVGFRGTGDISYQSALTAVLIEGAVFFLLAVTGVRFALVKLIPEPVRYATPAAIGAFLAHIGFQTAEGIGLVVSDIATAVTLGACPIDKRTPIVALTESCKADSNMCVISNAYTCDDLGGVMTSPTTWVGILGMMIILILLAYRIRSAFIIGIGFVTMISWFRNTAITYFPDDPVGDDRFEFFKKVVALEGIDQVLVQYTGDLSRVGLALFTFLYVDFLDTTGTLFGLVSAMGYVKEDGSFPRATQAFAADAAATMFGSLFGVSPVTSYVESGAGVETGSRTGVTAIFCGFFFFLSLFFAPIIASIPPWATGGALIIVGSLMARSLTKIQWHDISHAATAFIVVMVMPLTYSIGYGILAGLFVWVVMQGTFFLLSLVGIAKPVFVTEDSFETHSEPLGDDVTKQEPYTEEGETEHNKDKSVEDEAAAAAKSESVEQQRTDQQQQQQHQSDTIDI